MAQSPATQQCRERQPTAPPIPCQRLPRTSQQPGLGLPYVALAQLTARFVRATMPMAPNLRHRHGAGVAWPNPVSAPTLREVMHALDPCGLPACLPTPANINRHGAVLALAPGGTGASDRRVLSVPGCPGGPGSFLRWRDRPSSSGGNAPWPLAATPSAPIP